MRSISRRTEADDTFGDRPAATWRTLDYVLQTAAWVDGRYAVGLANGAILRFRRLLPLPRGRIELHGVVIRSGGVRLRPARVCISASAIVWSSDEGDDG